MILQSREQIERLQAVDVQGLEEVLVRLQLLARYLEVLRGQIQNFIQCLIFRSHPFCPLDKTVVYLIQGRYGCNSVLSTNFRSPASTAGSTNNWQNRSISCFNSWWGIGLMNLLAAIAVLLSNLPGFKAMARAARSASPSPTTWLTSPTACARVALKLRPVSSKSRTTPLPRSRFRRGIPPKPGIN